MSFDDYHTKLLVFDTNILFEIGGNGCDFCDFKLNKLFQNVADILEEKDLIDHVRIGIPEVVWQEIFQQRLRLFEEKNTELHKILHKFKNPFFEYKFLDGNYATFLTDKVNQYKSKLDNYSAKITTLSLPSNNRFDSIVQRAFMKKPPFEGIDKKSDKGFKDALIWESILEFKSQNPNIQMCLYSRDGLFNIQLSSEYKNLFNEEIELIKDEEGVMKFLNRIEKETNQFRIQQPNSIEHYSYLNSLITKKFINEILLNFGVSYKVRLNIYDFNSCDDLDIINTIDISSGEDLNSYTYEVLLLSDLVFSNGETNEDIDVKKEEIRLVFRLNNDRSIMLQKVNLLNTDYTIDFKLSEVFDV